MAIVLDGKSYVFASNVNGIASLVNPGATPATANVLSCQVQNVGKASAAKVRWKLKLPIASTDPAVAPVGGIDHTSFVDIVVTLAPQATVEERTDMKESIADLIADPAFAASLVNLVTPSA